MQPPCYGPVVYEASTGCDSSIDQDWQLAYLGDARNDYYKSFKGYGSCLVKHWENRNFGGTQTPLQIQDNDMGIMNAKASSIAWY